ncbi:MAG: hypothetical protein QM493_03870 [Sulfurovum sp.]
MISWKKYQNELIVIFSFLFMFGGYIYKTNIVANEAISAVETKKTLSDMRNVIALKKLWTDKKTSQRVAKLKSIVPISKVKWSNKRKKVKASYRDLSARELNKLISKILSLPIEIKLLTIQNISKSYSVEFKCKW